jgi:hypothetical protein
VVPVSMMWPLKVSRSTIAVVSRGVGEGFGPAAEWFVGGHRDGVAFFAFGEDLEE